MHKSHLFHHLATTSFAGLTDSTAGSLSALLFVLDPDPTKTTYRSLVSHAFVSFLEEQNQLQPKLVDLVEDGEKEPGGEEGGKEKEKGWEEGGEQALGSREKGRGCTVYPEFTAGTILEFTKTLLRRHVAVFAEPGEKPYEVTAALLEIFRNLLS
jgi:hypothetical protein